MAELYSKYQYQRGKIDLRLSSTQAVDFDAKNFHHRLRLYRYLHLKKFLSSLGESFDGKSVVVLGCGKGFDFHLIANCFVNADLTGVDISEVSIKLVKENFPNVKATLGNMEDLQFEDDTFDYALIPVALHHLQSVYRAVYEAIRISKVGAILIEPYDSSLARLATRLRAATEYEEVGNYVFRVSIKEMVKVGKAMFMEVRARPYMYIHYTARNSIDYTIWRWMNMVGNIAAPLVANECIVYFRKQVRVLP